MPIGLFSSLAMASQWEALPGSVSPLGAALEEDELSMVSSFGAALEEEELSMSLLLGEALEEAELNVVSSFGSAS